MPSLKLSEDLRPMSDLKSHGADIVRQVQDTNRPVVLTRHGRGVAVVMSLEDYEEIQELRERQSLRAALREAERELDAGAGVPHDRVRAVLEGWAQGD